LDVSDTGDRIRELRTERGLSQKTLADESGLTVRGLSAIEAGRAPVGLTEIAFLADALGVPPRDLLPTYPVGHGR
jgi:transcriptional regulator with XRE-family HTH domain